MRSRPRIPHRRARAWPCAIGGWSGSPVRRFAPDDGARNAARCPPVVRRFTRNGRTRARGCPASPGSTRALGHGPRRRRRPDSAPIGVTSMRSSSVHDANSIQGGCAAGTRGECRGEGRRDRDADDTDGLRAVGEERPVVPADAEYAPRTKAADTQWLRLATRSGNRRRRRWSTTCRRGPGRHMSEHARGG
jgi:hypothetical protein